MASYLEFENLQQSTDSLTEIVFCHVPSRAHFYRNYLLPTLSRVSRETASFKEREFEQPDIESVFEHQFPEAAQLYTLVCSVNKPNYRGARILLPTELNIPKWEEVLKGYFELD